MNLTILMGNLQNDLMAAQTVAYLKDLPYLRCRNLVKLEKITLVAIQASPTNQLLKEPSQKEIQMRYIPRTDQHFAAGS